MHGNIYTFDSAREDWTSYSERFEQYFLGHKEEANHLAEQLWHGHITLHLTFTLLKSSHKLLKYMQYFF